MFRWHSKVPIGPAAHAHAFCFQGVHVASFLQYSWQAWFLESCLGIRRLLFLFTLVTLGRHSIRRYIENAWWFAQVDSRKKKEEKYSFTLVDVSSISDSVSWYSWAVLFMYAEFLYKMFHCHLKVPSGQAAHAHAFCFQGAHVASFLQYTWQTWFLESCLGIRRLTFLFTLVIYTCRCFQYFG